ncbi:MAG: hypothetical protein ACD_47C00213G0001, partial [uncultured bacterium]
MSISDVASSSMVSLMLIQSVQEVAAGFCVVPRLI